MLQYFAQGACMALEDAICVGDNVVRHALLEDAFAAYQTDRFARTAKVQLMSRLIGDYIYHPSGGLAALRNATMRAKSPQDWFDTLDWLYGYGRTNAIDTQRGQSDVA